MKMDVLDEVREMLGGIDVPFLMREVILCGRRLFLGLGGCAEFVSFELRGGTYVSETTSGIPILYIGRTPCQ